MKPIALAVYVMPAKLARLRSMLAGRFDCRLTTSGCNSNW